MATRKQRAIKNATAGKPKMSAKAARGKTLTAAQKKATKPDTLKKGPRKPRGLSDEVKEYLFHVEANAKSKLEDSKYWRKAHDRVQRQYTAFVKKVLKLLEPHL